MAILSKGCKLGDFESHNSLKCSFTNTCGLCSSFVKCKSFPELDAPEMLALCETNLGDSIDSGNFCDGLSSFNLKGFYYSYAWSCSLCEGRTSTESYLCFRLALLDLVSSLLHSRSSIDHLLRLYAQFLFLFHLT